MVHSVLPTVAVASALCSVALLAPTAEAHQHLLLPNPVWLTDDKETKTNPLAFLENQGFKPQQDVAAFRKEMGYSSLQDFFKRAKYNVTSGATFDCGFTDINGAAQPIPEGGSIRFTGYTHDGPCMTLLDDKVVMESENCHETYPGKDFKIDYSSCKDKCTLYWYWLGVRFLKGEYSWQVYKNCVPLTASGGASDASQKS